MIIMAGIETRDLVIVLPGITGSVLAQQDPKGGKPKDLWAISGQALWQAVKSIGGSLHELAVPRHDPINEAPETDIVATRVILDFHGVLGLGKIDGYTEVARTILDNFEVADGRGFEWFPYDWRLSNRHSARRLAEFIKPRLEAWRKTHGADARVVLVAHSMGGLVARYFLEVLDGGHWRDCRALLTFGTPYRGSLSAVNFLANGYKKWAIRLCTLTEVMRSCPSVYELLPTYRAIEVKGEWKRAKECGALPNMDGDYVKAGAAFHDEIEKAVAEHRKEVTYRNSGYLIRPFVGVGQTTLQSAVLAGDVLTASARMPDWVKNKAAHAGGDGTVPRASAVPLEFSAEALESYVGERHGSLQRNEYVLDDFCERLRTMQAGGLEEFRGPIKAARQRRTIDLQVEDLFLPGEPVLIRARMSDGGALAGGLVAKVTPVVGEPRELRFGDGTDGWELKLEGLAAGLYRVWVRGEMGGAAAPTPVREVFEVAEA
jgi:pimeloyl-ACP methyl ester carboxylesterase